MQHGDMKRLMASAVRLISMDVTSEVVKNRDNTHGAVREGERDLMNGRLLIRQNENRRNLNGLW
jgi:hypothetical protein